MKTPMWRKLYEEKVAKEKLEKDRVPIKELLINNLYSAQKSYDFTYESYSNKESDKDDLIAMMENLIFCEKKLLNYEIEEIVKRDKYLSEKC